MRWLLELKSSHGSKREPAAGRHMAGAAKLDWPDDPEKDLGYHIRLIDLFAEKGDRYALNFALTFFSKGSNFNDNLHNMTRQMLIPFARDYIDYIKAKVGTVKVTLLPTGTEPPSKKVFVVHGHDEGAREAVARYLEKLGLEAIILHERASQGRTIIEKIKISFRRFGLRSYCSRGRFWRTKGRTAEGPSTPNVTLELGYFVGKLGRSHVCALKRGDIELPSDFGGVAYVAYDEAGGWKRQLGGELEAAGFKASTETS